MKGKVKVGLMFDSGGLEVDGSGLKVMQASERAIRGTGVQRCQRELSAATSPTSHFTSTGTDQHYYQMPLSSCDNYLLSAYIYTKYSRAICNFYSLPLLWPPEPHPL